MEFKVVGSSMQALDITLGDGERVFADSGKLVSKSDNVIMTPRLVGGLGGAIERKITGATGMLTEFKAKDGEGSLSLAGVIPGKIKHIVLAPDQVFVAEDYAFLVCDDKVKFTMQTVNIGAAFYGGAGLILQRFVGPGEMFMHVTGDVLEYELDGTMPLDVDPGHIAGFDGTLEYKIRLVDNIRTMMFGGVGVFLAKFTGKGKIMLHSVSRTKLAIELYLSAKRQKHDDGEG